MTLNYNFFDIIQCLRVESFSMTLTTGPGATFTWLRLAFARRLVVELCVLLCFVFECCCFCRLWFFNLFGKTTSTITGTMSISINRIAQQCKKTCNTSTHALLRSTIACITSWRTRLLFRFLCCSSCGSKVVPRWKSAMRRMCLQVVLCM
jgi:hypothetical protein